MYCAVEEEENRNSVTYQRHLSLQQPGAAERRVHAHHNWLLRAKYWLAAGNRWCHRLPGPCTSCLITNISPPPPPPNRPTAQHGSLVRHRTSFEPGKQMRAAVSHRFLSNRQHASVGECTAVVRCLSLSECRPALASSAPPRAPRTTVARAPHLCRTRRAHPHPPPPCRSPPLVVPRGGVGDRHLVNPNFSLRLVVLLCG